MLASSIRASVVALATLLLGQLSVHEPGKAVDDGLGTWVPATHVVDQDSVLCSCFGHASAPVTVGVWGVN